MNEALKNQFFHAVNNGEGFTERGDGNLGITIKVLSSDLDTTAKRGRRTRTTTGKKYTCWKAR